MSNILITMNEETESTRPHHFGVTYRVDEHDCLAYAAGLEALGHDVYFVNWNDLEGRQFARMFHDNAKRFVKPLPLEDFDLIWVYQMEGFYFDRPRFLRMVDVFEQAGTRVINDPRTIRHNFGKTYLWDLERGGIPIIPTYRLDASIVRRLAAGEPIVLKPLLAERGNDVFLARSVEDLHPIGGRESDYIAQDYMPGVRDGEKSLIYLGYAYQHAVLKRPNRARHDEFRCNESRGGTITPYEPAASELAFAGRVLRTYASFGCPVHYSRIDFIDTEHGPTLMEAELLNPAAFANYSKRGAEFGGKVAEYLDGLIAAKASSAAEALTQ